MKYLFPVCFWLISFVAKPSEVVIKGSISGFGERQIRAYTTEDYITSAQKKLASTPIEDGNFHLEFTIDETQRINLTIEDKTTSLFAEPGKVYHINLHYNEELNKSNIYDKFLSISFPFPSTQGINELISSFNANYEQFFQKNYKKIFLGLARKESIIFVDSIRAVERYKQNSFVENYVLYATANLLDISGIASSELKNEYLNGKSIAYRNPEYMNFFKQFFDERFRQFAISSEGAEMRKAIMVEKDLGKTLSIIQKGENLRTLELAELYLLHGLYEDYNMKTIAQESNRKMLEIIMQQGKTEENKLIAKNILNKLSLIKDGSKAPNFILKNSQGKEVSLADFNGKYVYLNFWSSWSIPSLKELNVMKNIYQKYNDNVEFISINLDDNKKNMLEILEKNNYPWPFLHYGNDYELKEKYQVRTIPSYYLIDPNGELVATPAPSPLNIEEILHNIK